MSDKKPSKDILLKKKSTRKKKPTSKIDHEINIRGNFIKSIQLVQIC